MATLYTRYVLERPTVRLTSIPGDKDNQKDAVKIYYLDLNEGFNKDYYVKENSNPKAKKISDLKMLDGTLLKIQKGKITKYLEGTEKIAQELKVTEEKE